MPNVETVGWREWVYLPQLGIGPIKAKMDSGARTTALHAYDVEVKGATVSFKVHTIQGRQDFFMAAEANLVDQRMVRDSGGNETIRPFIETDLVMAGKTTKVQISLINREDMHFRMLVGRTALSGEYLLDCEHEYLGGIPANVKNWKI